MPTPPANGRAPGRASHPVVGPLPWVAGRLHANQCTTDTPLPSDCSNSTRRITLPGTDIFSEIPHPDRRIGDGPWRPPSSRQLKSG
jgi:hypothetical protein